MSIGQLHPLLRHVRWLACVSPGNELSDDQLLARFQADREESAFAALLGRHGQLVWSVCRRVLGHDQDAEDAFQATFLALSRRASSIRNPEAVGSWLHGAAYRIAMRAKRDAAMRRKHELKKYPETHASGSPSAAGSPAREILLREGLTILDEEVERLGVRHRAVFIACCLEGKTMAEAARDLGWKEGTVSGTLSRAKERLRARLTRRGVTLSVALAALALSATASAAVPVQLIAATLQAAVRYASGGTAPAALAALIRAAGRASVFTRVKIAGVLLALAGLAAACAWAGTQSSGEDNKPKQEAASAKQQAKPDETIEVSGRVLNPKGKPVVGAKLYLPRWLKERPAGQDDIAVVERGVTDKDGRFKLSLPRKEAQPGRPVQLLANADGFGLDWIELPQKDMPGELTLRLVKDVPIRGRIVTTEGKPVAGVTVNVVGVLVPGKLDEFLTALQRGWRAAETLPHKQLSLPVTKMLRTTASDKDGGFEITGAGADRLVSIEVKGPGVASGSLGVITQKGLDTEALKKSLRVTEGDRERGVGPGLFGPTFEHVVESARPIEGTVREAGTDKPVADATIQVTGNVGVRAAVSDERGHYRIPGLRKVKQYTLNITAPKNAPFIGRWVRVNDTPGLDAIKVDVELTRGVIITGRVYDKVTGKGVESGVHFSPLPENKTAAKAPEGESYYASSDAEGRFRLVAIPGPGVLLAGVNGTRETVNGVRVHPYPINPYKTAEFSAEDSKRVKLSNDLEGFRSFLGAGGGLEPLDFSNACKVLDIKGGGEPVTCDLAVDPGKKITLHIQDTEGKPLGGAIVAGVTAGGSALSFKSDECPVYALDPKHPRQLTLLHLERKLAGVVSLGGDEKEPVTIKLSPAAVVTGRVLDMDGQPIAGAQVAVLYSGRLGHDLIKEINRRSGLPQTDKDGKFHIEGVVPNLKFDLGVAKGRQRLAPAAKLDVQPPGSGKSLNLGEIKVKPERGV